MGTGAGTFDSNVSHLHARSEAEDLALSLPSTVLERDTEEAGKVVCLGSAKACKCAQGVRASLCMLNRLTT